MPPRNARPPRKVIRATLASAFLVMALPGLPGGGADAAAQQAETAETAQTDTPEARMRQRFPQPIRVGDMIGWAVLDYDDVTLGHVQKVVRTPDGKIKLIVSYSKWFGWFGRPVAVPIEAVAALGRQLASLEMEPKDFAAAPTWTEGRDQILPENETIRIALTRR